MSEQQRLGAPFREGKKRGWKGDKYGEDDEEYVRKKRIRVHDYWEEKQQYESYLKFLPEYDKDTGVFTAGLSPAELLAKIMKEFRIRTNIKSAAALRDRLIDVQDRVTEELMRDWRGQHEFIMYRSRSKWRGRWRGRRKAYEKWWHFAKAPEGVELPKGIQTRLGTERSYDVTVYRP